MKTSLLATAAALALMTATPAFADRHDRDQGGQGSNQGGGTQGGGQQGATGSGGTQGGGQQGATGGGTQGGGQSGGYWQGRTGGSDRHGGGGTQGGGGQGGGTGGGAQGGSGGGQAGGGQGGGSQGGDANSGRNAIPLQGYMGGGQGGGGQGTGGSHGGSGMSGPPGGTMGGRDDHRDRGDRGDRDRGDHGRDWDRGRDNNSWSIIFGIGGHGYGADAHFGRSSHNRDFDRFRRAYRAPHRYRFGNYDRPRGWYYRRWTFGDFLPALFFAHSYWISDYEDFDLPYPPPGCVWVRYGDDALLVDRYSGEIIQVVYGIFY